MDTKGWILSLPPGAHALQSHECADVKTTLPKKRTARLENKENCSPGKTKKVKVDHGVLRGRSLLQDLVNDVS